jgi:YVTN family beta-propeller protein
MPTPARS